MVVPERLEDHPQKMAFGRDLIRDSDDCSSENLQAFQGLALHRCTALVVRTGALRYHCFFLLILWYEFVATVRAFDTVIFRFRALEASRRREDENPHHNINQQFFHDCTSLKFSHQPIKFRLSIVSEFHKRECESYRE